MLKNVGIWISRRKAVIVSLDADEEEILCIESEDDLPDESSGEIPEDIEFDSAVIKSGIPEGSESRSKRTDYYQKVIARLEDANYVLIFGPGIAKKELRAELKKIQNRTVRIAGMKPADEMTPEEIAVKVRRYFVAA